VPIAVRARLVLAGLCAAGLLAAAPPAAAASAAAAAPPASAAAPAAGAGAPAAEAAVRCWQDQLDWYRGAYAAAAPLPELVRDGIAGPLTATATRGFQRLAGLRPTGMADRATQRRMRLAEALSVRKRSDPTAARLLRGCR